MNKILFLALLVVSCTNTGRPLTEEVKEKSINEAKTLISTIFQAAEKCDPEMMTSTFLNSEDFVSFINGDSANYEATVKKYPTLMSDFKTQKATILNENYTVIDASTISYSSKSNWECTLQNDSVAVFDNVGMELLLKKADNNWKVLHWTEVY